MKIEHPKLSRALLPPPLALIGPLAALLLLLGAMAQRTVPVDLLLRDPGNSLQYPFYVGFLSHLGALAWCAGATVCLFTAQLVDGRRAALLRYAGVLTTLLLVDDFFLLHEEVLPLLFGTNTVSRISQVVYVLGIVGLLVIFWRLLLATPLLLLALALGCLGASVLLDVTDLAVRNYVLEDGLKFVGIVSWTSYLLSACGRLARAERATPAAGARST